MSRLKALLIAIVLFAALRSARAVAAQSGAPPGAVTDDEVNRVAKQLYCPVCENVPLDVCPTQACAQWRATIRQELEAGWSDQQILDYFAAQYGERVLAAPSSRGLNVLVWIVPPVLVAAGAWALWRFLRANTHAQRPAPGAGAPAEAAPTDEYSLRLEQELRQRI